MKNHLKFLSSILFIIFFLGQLSISHAGPLKLFGKILVKKKTGKKVTHRVVKEVSGKSKNKIKSKAINGSKVKRYEIHENINETSIEKSAGIKSSINVMTGAAATGLILMNNENAKEKENQ